MASNVTTYGDISPRTATLAAKRLLAVGQPLITTQRFGMIDDQPQKKSKTRKWRRYHAFAAATSPLAEGIAPAGHALTYTDVVATLEQYGDLVEITDVVEDTHEDPVLQVSVDRSGEQAAETVEVVTIDVLKAGTNVYYANNVTSRATVNSGPTRADLRRVVRGFDRNKAKRISRIVSPSALFATEPVEAGFFAMGHTDLEPDIRNITGFKPVAEYSNPGAAIPGEIGAVERIRFVLTPLFTAWEAAATSATGTTYLSSGAAAATALAPDVYPLLIVARDAYAVVRLQGRQAAKVMVLNPNKPRGGDPLGQKGTVSWKTYYTAAILNEEWIARLECACTANPT
jgi:N4-gp56 family major capsid protein